MASQRVRKLYLLVRVSGIISSVLLALLVSGCENDKLGADKIEAQDAKGPIPPLKYPPEFEKIKVEPPKLDNKHAADVVLTGLDIPLYPGAEPASSTNDAIAANKSYGVTLGVFETKDTIDKVIAFYKSQFPAAGSSSLPTTQHAEWTEDNPGGIRTVHVNVTEPSKGDGLKTIEIAALKDKTQINLMRVASGKLTGEVPGVKTPHQ